MSWIGIVFLYTFGGEILYGIRHDFFIDEDTVVVRFGTTEHIETLSMSEILIPSCLNNESNFKENSSSVWFKSDDILHIDMISSLEKIPIVMLVLPMSATNK